jgi:hypothetical protein
VIAVGAKISADQKYDHPILLVGNPAKALPITSLTKSAKRNGKYID